MDIKLACMSLMWGWQWDQSLLTTWIDDVTYADYDGVACFDGQLTGCPPEKRHPWHWRDAVARQDTHSAAANRTASDALVCKNMLMNRRR